MLKITSALLLSATLFSTASHAMGREQQWEDWYGNISAMEFELNTQNTTGEVLTLTCTSGKLAVAYSVPAEDYRASSQTGLAEPGLSINGTNHLLDETAFTALKSAGNKGVINITSMNAAISKKFSAKGLNEALADVTWQDCINH
ncbi:hypothetical protein [Atlantibacter hermannii]|uniref:hypothetical protein n=1 Tax=Atlantibacter hermannii TaxID=565 RepID=UPI0015FAD345|nr:MULTISPECIES: hypothetical protein [Enterobacteriaceae]MBA8035112.1 hypothetical protein [Citrobacter freundii]MBL7636924.1 hypothetical protein [Atlantibacter hermannii]MBL7675480.1 hypothetical protein [Atlantibacter hermannii]